VTCAKLGEAEVMAAAGIKDILIANEVVGPHKIKRLVHLQRQDEVKVAVDSEVNAQAIGQAAREIGVEVGVLVDVDNGMGRAGVSPGEAALALSQQVHAIDGLRYMGLMAWEGHAVAITDADEKRTTIDKAISALAETANLCREAGLPVEIVSGGGSGTYLISAELSGLTEIQAGGAIFCDARYRAWGAHTKPSLFVQAVVTSRPTPERIIIDAGYKSLPGWHGAPEAIDLSGVKAIKSSAEHGTILLEEPNTTIQVGDLLDFMVGYGDSTVYLHDQLYGLRHGLVEVVWDIAGRGKLS
jgi:D-serine deaminase-like pyridoxal phosphate-dependent protein